MNNIYKVAQTIQFANPVNVKTKINKLKDNEFKTYLSVLSQIHEDLQNGVDLEEAIVNASDFSYLKVLTTLINEIGLHHFMNADFSKIIKALTELRPAKEPISTVLPGVTEAPKPKTQPFAVSNIQDFVIQDLLRRTTGERIEYFETLEYPDEIKNKAEIMLENLKAIDYAYSDKDTPRSTKEFYEKELVSAMISLLEMVSGAYQEIEPEFDETGKGNFKTKKKKQQSVLEQENPDEDYFESNASAASKLNEDNIFDTEVLREPSFKEFQTKSNNPYIDFSVTPPVFNEDMDLAFGNFLKKIEAIFQSASTKGATSSLKQEFNDAVFVIKSADVMTYEELKKYMKDIPKGLETQYKNIEHRFINECPSAKILKDEHFNTLFFSTLVLSAPRLGELFLAQDMSLLENESERLRAKRNFTIHEIDFDTIKETMELFSKTQFRSKATSFFQLTSRHKQNNFIDKSGLRWDIVFKRALQKVYTQGPEYNLRPCPTCYKMVPWTYTKVAKKNQKELEGYRVRLVSFLTNNKDKPKITLEELNSRKWPAPPDTIYSEEREQQLVIKYAKQGERSWEEIQALISSNNPELHEEGLHRRTGALYHAGGVFLTAKDILIKHISNECPFDTSGNAGSLCGVSFVPDAASSALSKRMSLQPQWNGTKDSVESDVKSNILIEELWSDKELFEKAKRMQSGGFKFSKINLACTCRISKIDSLSSYKHNSIAISKAGVAGSPGFVYPTQPNGLLDTNLEDGTLSYLVCGAPTSLSSFDRSPESSGFILKYLQRIRDTSVQDYQKLTTYLIRHGVDVQDVMELDQDLDQYVSEGLEKQSNTVQSRMAKLAEIIKTSNIDLSKDSERRQYLGGLTLVCPFGHKFNVEHSLQFAEANAGIFQKDEIVTEYGPIITSQGENNLKELLKAKYLIPADSPEVSYYTTKLPYEEWVKHPDGIVFPEYNDPNKPLLLFRIPINLEGQIGEFVFYKKGQGWKDSVWSSDSSYETARFDPRNFESSSTGGLARITELGDEGGGGTNLDLQAAEQWRIDENNPVSEYDFNRLPTTSIPGAENLEDSLGNINPAAFDQRIASFARALKSVLRIITTWTKGLISSPMINSMLTDYTIDISRHAEGIVAPMLPLITLEDFDGESLSPEKSAAVVADIKKYMVDQINKKGNALYDWIRSNIYTLEEDQDFDKQVAINIIVAAMKDFNSFKESGFDSDHGVAFMDIETLDKNAKVVAKKIVDSIPELVLDLTLRTEKYYESVRKDAQYNGRINMVGYAQYLATILPTIYKKYCADEESYFYIGYNIGIDLSTPTKILGYEKDGKWVGGITEAQVDNITSSFKEAIEISGNFRKPKPQTLHYGHRIDRAWEELEAYLKRARKQAISGRAMELAKSYIIDRISVMSGKNAEQIADKIANSFPTRSLLFNGTTEKPETGTRLITKGRLPFISKDITFLDLNGGQEVQEWIVRNKRGNTNQVFSTEADAKAYLQQAIANNPGLPPDQWIVEPDSYWINTEKGYDGSKNQIGMFCPKVTKDYQWPPAPGTMDFVGITLPFIALNTAADDSMSKAKDFPIPSYRFEIEFDGEPLNISFLFRRGRSQDELDVMNKAEQLIINAVMESKISLSRFAKENASAIQKNPDILANATAREEDELATQIEPYLKMVDALPLYITTKQSYMDLTTKARRQMVRVALEDPMRAYKLIMNPEIRGVILTPTEKKRLIQFIIRVYNLDLVRDLARMQGGVYANLETIDLFEKAETLKFKFLAKKLQEPIIRDADGNEKLGWVHDSGEYFNLIPGEEGEDTGSYLQYVFKSSQNAKIKVGRGEHPDIKALITQGEIAAADRRNAGKGDKEATTEAISNQFARKMESEMLDYIRNRTSGERKNEVKDGRRRKKIASEETEKISLRRSKLERTILSLGLEFDDVEVPQF